MASISCGGTRPDTLRVELRERRRNEIAALHPTPLNDERPQRLEKANLQRR
jgi:hypothetical protein